MRKCIILIFLALATNAFAERYEFRSNVNRWIYGEDLDTIGVRDTIFIDQHILIEDINIFPGIGEWGNAGRVLIVITSPQHSTVWLNTWRADPPPDFFVWYDTDREEDGPGQLEDYAGGDAFGAWELFCFDPFVRRDSNFWYYWSIEVIGTPLEGISDNKGPLPTRFEFSNIYPNPFNGEAAFQYGLPEAAIITFDVYNIEGRVVRRISCGELRPGYHCLIWDGVNNDGKRAASGIYMVRMTAGDRQFTRKAVILK